MARTSTSLSFKKNTEEAFNFYKSVFGTDFVRPIARFAEMPENETCKVADEDKNLILHVELPILGGHILMGSDAPESMNFKVNFGNNIYITLEPDTRAETEKLFIALSANGQIEMPLQDMFWGAYFGSCTDRFGVKWMVNCMGK